ncbi:MAG: hypothetical protein VKJ05_04010 [Synechococcaceae cyanobacterium]|nr:hypothetical protein [Synechococcaceae cyanobacterium]
MPPPPAAKDPAEGPVPPATIPPAIARWIRTDCGREKYRQLAARPGVLARLRLAWFVVIGAVRDRGTNG